MAKVEVAGMWELGWSAPITESVLWEYAMREFGVERLNMTPVSGISKKWVFEYQNMDSLLSDRSHLEPVFVDENAQMELREFEHPQNALYVFGKGSYSPFSAMARNHQSVKIKSSKPGLMWPHQTLAVVLYDRASR